MSIENIIALLALLAVVIGGFFTVYGAICRKIDSSNEEHDQKVARVYERMDENKDEFYRNFVLTKVYDESKKNQNELNDQKFISLIKLFETNLNYVTSELKALREQINGSYKNGGH